MKNKSPKKDKKLMDKTTRLNIYLDPVVVKAAKIQAQHENVPVNQLIEKVLKDRIPRVTMDFASGATQAIMKPNAKELKLPK